MVVTDKFIAHWRKQQHYRLCQLLDIRTNIVNVLGFRFMKKKYVINFLKKEVSDTSARMEHGKSIPNGS
jgi:hypothetical protein